MDKGNEKKHWKYKGEIKNGKPNGKGQLFSAFGKYEGEVKEYDPTIRLYHICEDDYTEDYYLDKVQNHLIF